MAVDRNDLRLRVARKNPWGETLDHHRPVADDELAEMGYAKFPYWRDRAERLRKELVEQRDRANRAEKALATTGEYGYWRTRALRAEKNVEVMTGAEKGWRDRALAAEKALAESRPTFAERVLAMEDPYHRLVEQRQRQYGEAFLKAMEIIAEELEEK